MFLYTYNIHHVVKDNSKKKIQGAIEFWSRKNLDALYTTASPPSRFLSMWIKYLYGKEPLSRKATRKKRGFLFIYIPYRSFPSILFFAVIVVVLLLPFSASHIKRTYIYSFSEQSNQLCVAGRFERMLIDGSVSSYGYTFPLNPREKRN